MLVDLAIISAAETDIETARITCLHTSCLGFAPLIFVKPDFGFDDVMKACKPVWDAVESDPHLPQKLVLLWFRHLDSLAFGSLLRLMPRSYDAIKDNVISFSDTFVINIKLLRLSSVPLCLCHTLGR